MVIPKLKSKNGSTFNTRVRYWHHRHVGNYVFLPLVWCVTKNVYHELRSQYGATPMIPLSPELEQRFRHSDSVVELS